MAHTICGIDVGAYSIKFAFFEVGFRTKTLRGLLETAVPAGDAPLLQRQMDAVREGLAQVSGEVTPYFALPGDQLSVRVLELPFSDSRKIDQVVGYELEGEIVHAIEDVVFDHLVVGQRPEGSTVMAAAARRDDLATFVAAAEDRGIHPRALFAAPLIYRALLPFPADVEAGAPIPCQVVLDFGHQRTNICFVRGGEPIFARTIRRGGEHLTAAIAKAFNADVERAEQAKRADAFLASPGRLATTPLSIKLDTVLRETLAPSIRELRQTLAGFRAANRFDIDALLVVGAAAGWPVCCRTWRRSWGSRPGILRPARRWNRAASSPLTARARRAPRPKPTSTRWPRRSRSARAAARARSTSGAGRSSTAPASRSCARRRRTSPRWRVRC